MGRSITPKYRLEIQDRRTGNNRWLMLAWSVKHDGKVNDANLAKWVDRYIASLQIGGVNSLLSQSLGFIPVPTRAQIIMQSGYDWESPCAQWEAPAFLAF